jgi:hypothetical protein
MTKGFATDSGTGSRRIRFRQHGTEFLMGTEACASDAGIVQFGSEPDRDCGRAAPVEKFRTDLLVIELGRAGHIATFVASSGVANEHNTVPPHPILGHVEATG